MRGNCYVTSEALFHLLGGRDAGWRVMRLHHEGGTHWYLQHRDGIRLDPTASQFETPPDYSQGVATGFLTRKPSRRAAAMMKSLVWQSN